MHNFAGITAVGDIHGDYASMKAAVDHAQRNNHFFLSLGDITDRGPDSTNCINLMYDLLIAQQGGSVLGNHCHKVGRWFRNVDRRDAMRLSHANRSTIDPVMAMADADRDAWIAKYLHVIDRAADVLTVGNVKFAHAAVLPDYWDNPFFKDKKQTFMFGQKGPDFDALMKAGNERPPLIHDWVNAIPLDHMVFVGHEVMGDKPTVKHGTLGGMAFFMDTGMSKGGQMSYADLAFDGDRLVLKQIGQL